MLTLHDNNIIYTCKYVTERVQILCALYVPKMNLSADTVMRWMVLVLVLGLMNKFHALSLQTLLELVTASLAKFIILMIIIIMIIIVIIYI